MSAPPNVTLAALIVALELIAWPLEAMVLPVYWKLFAAIIPFPNAPALVR